MSSYVMTVRNKKTGEETQVWAIDDYFSPHAYGYQFLSGVVLTGDELAKKYERF